MNNSYFQYEENTKNILKYREAIELLEQELIENGGEFSQEIENKFKEIEQDAEILAWEILQLQDGIVSNIEQNEERIKNLEKKNKSLKTQEKYFDSLLSILIKEQGKLTGTGNINLKLAERSISLQKNISYEVLPEFNDNRFIRYNLKGKLTEENANRIKKFLEQKGEEGELEMTILKKELNSYIKETEEIPEGVNQVVKQTLYKR